MPDSEARPPAVVAYFVLAWAVFALSRLAVLLLPAPASDVSVYAEFVRECETAARQGRSIYDLRAETRAHGEATGRLERFGPEYRNVEYPPLAIAVMRLPVLWMRRPATDSPADFTAAYVVAYHRGLAVIDVLLFGTITRLVRRFYPRESSPRQAGRLLFYAGGTFFLWHLLHDRLDLIQALAVTLALALLVSRAHYAWSFAVLALAVNFKLVPLVLAPVWVVGSLPADRPLTVASAGRLAARALLLAGLTLGALLPFYLSDGRDCLGFLRYHGARGLEVESVWSCLPLAARACGYPAELDFSYGSVNVRSPLTPRLVDLASWATVALLLAATVLLFVRARRLAAARGSPAAPTTLAQLHPAQFAAFGLLFLMPFVAANKVFSPQYLLWLLPLAALVPFRQGPRRAFFAGCLLVCVLSTVLMPFLFASDLIVRTAPDAAPLLRGPTARFVAVLLLRNLLFLGLTAAVAVWAIRAPSSAGRSTTL